jgi:hypothetical protein
MRPYALFLFLAATGCDSSVGPNLETPPDAAPTEALADYPVWYAEVEACVGVTGNFDLVRWYSVPGERWWDPEFEQYAIGTWRSPHDIYLASTRLEDKNLVKHEIVHDLLQGGLRDDPRFLLCSNISH